MASTNTRPSLGPVMTAAHPLPAEEAGKSLLTPTTTRDGSQEGHRRTNDGDDDDGDDIRPWFTIPVHASILFRTAIVILIAAEDIHRKRKSMREVTWYPSHGGYIGASYRAPLPTSAILILIYHSAVLALSLVARICALGIKSPGRYCSFKLNFGTRQQLSCFLGPADDGSNRSSKNLRRWFVWLLDAGLAIYFLACRLSRRDGTELFWGAFGLMAANVLLMPFNVSAKIAVRPWFFRQPKGMALV